MPQRPSLVSGDVRRHNLSLVLQYVARSGPSARSEIADATGLTRGAVTALTAALTEVEVLQELQPDQAEKGRPVTRLALGAPTVAILVAQVDADTATALLTSLAGDELFRVSAHHGRPMGDPGVVLDALADVVGDALEEASAMGRRVAELPVVVFAPVGGDPPMVLADTDLAWGRVDVLGGLRERLPELAAATTVVSLASDGWLAALAERSRLVDAEAGAGFADELVYLKSNSGIGGALVSGGRVIEGAHGVGGALGHLAVVPDGVRCECGQVGCLVTVAGPDVLLERAGLSAAVAADGLGAALDELSRRILDGEPLATAGWNDALPWIARALQILSLASDPGIIVIGGFWAPHTESIERAFRANRPAITGVDGAASGAPLVVAGRLGADAALLGAVWSARDRLLADALRLAV